MLRISYFVLIIGVLAENEKYYETYTGNIISLEQYKEHVKANTTYWCTGTFTPCQVNGSRTIDGSCNNLKHPTRGTPHTPFISDLPLVFDKGNEPVKLKTGEDIEPRKVRLDLLSEGNVPDQKFTILLVHYLLLAFSSIGSLHDTVNYVHWRPYCCKEKGKTDPICYPMKVRPDDIVHQYTDVRCFNNTRPLTYQLVGCVHDKSTEPARLTSGRTFMDMGVLYILAKTVRSYDSGKLIVEEENGKIWPMSVPPAGICLLNQPGEKRCHANPAMNSLFGINFLGTIFWRYHNFIAEQLQKVNPCWEDDKLFYEARNILIAQFTQIYYYEMMPLLIDSKTLIKEGVISRDKGFRDLYQEKLIPQQSLEYTYVLRWLHTVQPGNIEKYDDSGNYLGKVKVTNTTFHTGILPLDNNMEGFTQGSFRQPAGKFDHIVDPIISENGLPVLQYSFDITAADLLKGGLFGLQSYIAYRKLCTGKTYKTFADLSEDVEPANLELMQNSFKYVEDVPLMVGLWLEKHIPNGNVPRTFACIKIRQLKRFIAYDRHWYERPNRPHAFNSAQLEQIRKSSIARILCDVGDTVKSITPNAFLREGPRNKMTSCNNIPKIDFGKWRDPSYKCSNC